MYLSSVINIQHFTCTKQKQKKFTIGVKEKPHTSDPESYSIQDFSHTELFTSTLQSIFFPSMHDFNVHSDLKKWPIGYF